MAIKYEVVAKNGTYTADDGSTKTRYLKIGIVVETANGLSLKLESMPIGFDGWAYLNEPKSKGDTHKQAAGDDDIPF